MTDGVNENIILNVGNRGLSYAIDNKLDTELGQDVKLNVSEWQSVFDIIKQEQVQENKSQFGENDTDIKNGKHYIVQQNEIYQIKQSVWNQIVDIAKKSMGISENTELETPKAEQELNNNKTSEELVKDVLTAANLEIDEDLICDIVRKYDAIKQLQPDINEETLNTRIINYTKGLNYHKTELQYEEARLNEKPGQNFSPAAGLIDIDGALEAMQEGDQALINGTWSDKRNEIQAKFNTAFHQKAKEYIELYDNNGDGKIDFDELIKMEENDLGRELTAEEKTIIGKEAVNRLAILNQDTEKTTLDENEIAAYLWTMSKINDGQSGRTGNSISYDEWKTSKESMDIMGIVSGKNKNRTEANQKIIDLASPHIKEILKDFDTINNFEDINESVFVKSKLNQNERTLVINAINIFKSEGTTLQMIKKSAIFETALKVGYDNLKQ